MATKATKPTKPTKVKAKRGGAADAGAARRAAAAERTRTVARPAGKAKVAAPSRGGSTKPAAETRAKAAVPKPRQPAPPKRAAAPPKPVAPKPVPAKPARAAKPRKIPRAAAQRRHVHFRALLSEVQRGLLRSYLAAKGQSRADGPSGTEDYIDYAVSSYTREFSLSLTEMERHRLRLVEEALGRLERGEYGRCLQCANEIPPPRLEVEPWARHCVRCQELEEQGLLERRDAAYGDEEEADLEEDVEAEVVVPEAEGLDEEAEPEEVIEDDIDRGVEEDEI